MPSRLALIIVASIALGLARSAGASPITYDFTGNFAGLGLNGLSPFSGTLTINGDPTVSTISGLPSVSEARGDVSLTLKAGGQTFEYSNQANPASVATFSVGVSPSWTMYPGPSAYDPSGLPYDEAMIYGAIQGGKSPSSVGISFYNYDPSAVYQLGNLRNFNLPAGTGSIFMTSAIGTAGGFVGEGTITSMQLVPTPAPEPSTLAVFAALGFAAMAHRRLRRP